MVETLLQAMAHHLWGIPLLLLLVVTGCYLTWRVKGLQFRYLGYALKLAFSRVDGKAKGDINHFQALMVAMAAMIGIGSIAGVATAIAVGGLGALFWMWVAALIGMAIKYSEGVLAVKYRTFDASGQAAGGPMYYISRGLGWKKLAGFYALAGMFAAFTTGNMTQTNAVAEALQSLCSIDPIWVGGAILAVTALVIVGGVQNLGKVCSYLVPLMAILYLGGVMIILLSCYDRLPQACLLIFKTAFSGQAAVGGFAGSSILMAMRMGVARGILANEAGLGTSSIAAAAAKTDTPARQAIISMTGAFLTTLMCTFSGLTIAVTGVLGEVTASGVCLNGVTMMMAAFSRIIPWGAWIVTVGAVFFGTTTIFGWAYYGERCSEYLLGARSVRWYRLAYLAVIIPGSMLSLDIVWNLADIANACMTLANLVGLLFFGRIIARETRDFVSIVNSEKLRLPEVIETAKTT